MKRQLDFAEQSALPETSVCGRKTCGIQRAQRKIDRLDMFIGIDLVARDTYAETDQVAGYGRSREQGSEAQGITLVVQRVRPLLDPECDGNVTGAECPKVAGSLERERGEPGQRAPGRGDGQAVGQRETVRVACGRIEVPVFVLLQYAVTIDVDTVQRLLDTIGAQVTLTT